MRVLVIDIGGTHVKLLMTGRRVPLKLPSGPDLTPRQMAREVIAATKHWRFDAVTIGYPGPVVRGHIDREPVNLGVGWMAYNFSRAFKKPVRIINDAAMQALGSYEGGNMLFLGLGTGLGNAMIRNGDLIPMEVGHLPYKNGLTYEDYIGEAGMKKLGKAKWRRHVERVCTMFLEAFVVDYIVLGGGNVRHLKDLPPGTRRGSNDNAFRGGFRLWAPPRHRK